MLRGENGITLVALIITIIILVILAAVSITAAYQSGIINYAVNGTANYAQAASDENTALRNAEQKFSSAITRIEGVIESIEANNNGD